MTTPLQPTLYSIIQKNNSIIPILNRLGIRLGVGDMTLDEAANAAGITTENMPFVRLLVKTGCGEQIPVDTDVEWTPFVKEYFSKSTNYFKTVQLPNIERHLKAFIGMSMGTDTAKGQLIQLSNLLDEFSKMITDEFDLTDNDRTIKAEGLLSEMQLVMIKYLKGNFNDNLCHATIFALRSFETGIATHRNIFASLLQHSKTGTEKKTDIYGKHGISRNTEAEAETETETETDPEKTLTPRETEVLALVAQGKINKEIADLLEISFQTVLTHRKNISAKLGIKTTAGLTIYAIKAGLIEL